MNSKTEADVAPVEDEDSGFLNVDQIGWIFTFGFGFMLLVFFGGAVSKLFHFAKRRISNGAAD